MIFRLDTPSREFGQRGSSPGTLRSTEIESPFPFDSQTGRDQFVLNFEEIECGRTCPLCRIYRAPLLSDTAMRVDLQLSPTKRPLREIVVLRERTFVSERVRGIIEEHDDFGHQFREIRLWNHRDKSIDPGQPFFQMNMRRFVSLHPLGRERDNEKYEDAFAGIEFYTENKEKAYLPTIWHRPAVREKLESLPLWQHFTADRPEYRHQFNVSSTPLYLNESMLRALQRAGVNGVAEYTRYCGKHGEYVTHV